MPTIDVGPPLDGEWLISDSASVRLVYGAGVWRFITIREINDTKTAAADGTRYYALREPIELVAGKLAGELGRLRYAVYWGAPDPQDPSGMRRLASRFLGFGARGE